tara:strand:- start:2229 stop:3062 length:834 start_codon:yes stop_codon:yes gene_type:complete
MANPFNGIALPDWLKDVFITRGKQGGWTKWKAEKRSWMKLISNSSAGLGEISGESNSWTPENMYREVDGIIAAAPSLESLEITTTGTAGSMRRAKVKFKVYNTQQLRQAQQAFFIPGMSAVILWGWNMQSSGKSVSSSPDVSGTSLHTIQAKIKKWVVKSNGSCDGLVGLISEFDWSKSAGGGADGKGYDCTITMESPAKTFVAGEIKLPTPKSCGCQSGGESNSSPKGGWVKQALKNQAEAFMRSKGPGKVWKDSDGNKVGTSIKYDQEYDEDKDI